MYTTRDVLDVMLLNQGVSFQLREGSMKDYLILTNTGEEASVVVGHQENVQKIQILPESQELPVVKSSFRKWQEML